ncbi:hypothetical protein BWI93_04080 [Siphonobacter sp. BAB-5385]|uniref:hypothetical protein n=1 Tax=Siphonobacter sp. BAB-5385 TaxID=1864822 RepID=UPI000B9EC092|nr:hypothetical protein [Siphonobacter sp. BAB-5385]OZI09347.1 hypothetical protein BWI93_04080 [Siphonobacter sp. BAB-5385]
MNWPERYKRFKKHYGLTNKKVAELIGNTEDSVRVITRSDESFPAWAKLAIIIFEREHIDKE